MKLSEITPLGRADKVLKEETRELDEQKKEKYKDNYRKYRKIKTIQISIKILLYASIITSIAAAVGFNAEFIAKISSYVGTTLLIILYSGLTYFTKLYRETYLVRREILISSQD